MNVIDRYLASFGSSCTSDLFAQHELKWIEATLNPLRELVYPKDEWGNVDETQIKNCKTPFLDEFVVNRLKSLQLPIQRIWPKNHPFAICLTHDVDRVEAYSPKVFKRNIAKQFQHVGRMKQLKLAINYLKTSVKQLLTRKKEDPIWNFEKWKEIEAQFGVFSTYFFFVRTKKTPIHLYDCDFELEDTFKMDGQWLSVKDYIVDLYKNGHEIGLHGSFASAKDATVFSDQKRYLEQVLGQKIVATRQHYLHFQSDITPKVHIQNALKVDSTLGLNRSAGFRNGTAMPFVIKNNEGYIWELPLIFMDSAILGCQNMDLEAAKRQLMLVMDQVQAVGGCLTVNFHPDYVNEPKYFELYHFLLQVGKERNAYFGTCKEIINIVESCVE